ncbi:hypothetical protein HDV01_002873 [Terramyces sp. JEL0728]|nr:hypothetical protein HDV01_002873 [Terramyces sp. JEL0728]
MSEIVENFRQLRFYPGIIELALLKSSEYVIPDNLAVDVNNPYNEILDLRQRCYELIFGTFSSISTLGSTGQMSKDQTEKYTKVLLGKALTSDDRNFHYSLYTWFINQNWIDKLLEIQSPYFEAFLIEKKRDLTLADYLCKFYVRNNRFFEAAQLLSEIAYYPELKLDTRLSYLANAIANAKSSTGSNTQELVGQLNDLLDVARIQADIAASLRNIPDTELLLHELEGELLDLATLPPWSSNDAIAFLINNILKLVQIWFDYIRSPATSFYEREEFPAREIDELLSRYLSNLPMDNKVLSRDIQKLQSRLRSSF